MCEKKMSMQRERLSIDVLPLSIQVKVTAERKHKEDALLDCLDRISDQDLTDYLDVIGADDGEENLHEEALGRINRSSLLGFEDN